MKSFEFEAIGTHWQIDIHNNLSHTDEVILLDRIHTRISEFDAAYSRFRIDSIVAKMSQEAGEYALPSDADLMMTTYRKIYDATGGLVTPLIGQVLVDAGYDATYSLKERPLSVPQAWDAVMVWQNPTLTLSKPVLLDFGAGGKGYLVDIISELIEKEGITDYCVDAGGDMRQRGQHELRVGLENPMDTTEAVGVVHLKDKSLCGSAGNRRRWGRFHHVIDPQKLLSPEEVLAVWTVADTTLVADILTTGLFFASPQVLGEKFDFEYFIIRNDYSVEKSQGFPAEIFTA